MGCMAKHLAERLHTLLHQSHVCLAAHVADAKHLACQGSVIAAGNHAVVAQVCVQALPCPVWPL